MLKKSIEYRIKVNIKGVNFIRLPLLLFTSLVTDATAFTQTENNFELVIYGPGISTLPQQVDEYVSIEDYLSKIEEYKAIIKEYLK